MNSHILKYNRKKSPKMSVTKGWDGKEYGSEKNVKAGECIFPYKVWGGKGKIFNECNYHEEKSKKERGKICATSLSEKGYMNNYGFCNSVINDKSKNNNVLNNVNYPKAPDGWKGPHKRKFLTNIVKDSNGKKIDITDFDKAIKIAEKYDECTGITKTNKGYSLRKSKTMKKITGTNIGHEMASWTKKPISNSSVGKRSKKSISNSPIGKKSKKANSNSPIGKKSKKANSNSPIGKKSKKANSNSSVQRNWVNDAFKDTNFRIIETRSNGDCFFDSVRLGLPSSHKKTVTQLRQLLLPYLTYDIFERDLGLYTSAKDGKRKSIIEKAKVMKSNSSKKRDQLNKLEFDLTGANETIEEWAFFDRFKIDSLDKYKDFLLNNYYWANSWSLSIIEKELNIKLIILSERSYLQNDEYNILQCGDFEANNDSIPYCKICGMTQREREFLDTDGSDELKKEIYKNAVSNHGIEVTEDDTLSTLIVKYSDLPDDHKFEDKEDIVEEYIPNGYIIVTYSGNHYRLVSYNNNRFFKTLDELPSQLVQQIKRKCNNVGLYKRIKDVGL